MHLLIQNLLLYIEAPFITPEILLQYNLLAVELTHEQEIALESVSCVTVDCCTYCVTSSCDIMVTVMTLTHSAAD